MIFFISVRFLRKNSVRHLFCRILLKSGRLLPLPCSTQLREVWNDFFNFGSVFERKKTRILFGMSLVRFGSKNAVRFGYYSYLLLM